MERTESVFSTLLQDQGNAIRVGLLMSHDLDSFKSEQIKVL